MTDDYGAHTPFGFVWGPAEITRCALLPKDSRVLQIKTPYRSLDVYVSATGRSVRVFSDGEEWTA
jgi:hypothetical protein